VQPEASRILSNIVVLLKSGLFTGQVCGAVPEALQFVEHMLASAAPVLDAEAYEPGAEVDHVKA
jgi:hypothetical protein